MSTGAAVCWHSPAEMTQYCGRSSWRRRVPAAVGCGAVRVCGSCTSPMASSALQHEPPALRRKAATDKLVKKIIKHDSWPIQPDILSPPLLSLTSRKLLWLDLQPVDIKRRWKHNWKSALVVNSHLMCDPTIRQPGFDLPRQQWSLLNHFRTEQGLCGACRSQWQLTDTDLCPCGET